MLGLLGYCGGGVEERAGAMTVGVCGPGVLVDNIRSATRGVMGGKKAEFWEDTFT